PMTLPSAHTCIASLSAMAKGWRHRYLQVTPDGHCCRPLSSSHQLTCEGTLRASWESYGKIQGAAYRLNGPNQSWLGAVGIFVAVGIAYFLAARVGVVLGVSQG